MRHLIEQLKSKKKGQRLLKVDDFSSVPTRKFLNRLDGILAAFKLQAYAHCHLQYCFFHVSQGGVERISCFIFMWYERFVRFMCAVVSYSIRNDTLVHNAL